MIFSVAISMLFFTASVYLMCYAGRTMVALGNYQDLNRKSRHALDVMTKDIRQAKHMTAYATNQLTFVNEDGSSLVYQYKASKGTLVRATGASELVLLSNIDYLTFDISQRNPNTGFTFYSANGIAAQAKLVDINWHCSEKIFGVSANTESIQSAKVVVRN
jgi:hypothetical protein